MLSEFVNRIEQLAKAANSVQVGECAGAPDSFYVRVGDKLDWKEKDPAKRAHTIDALGDFIELVKDTEIAPNAEVYHCSRAIVAILDAGKRREVVSMPLVFTQRWTTLTGLGGEGKAFDAAGAIRFLRFDLHGVGADTLIPDLRRIDFTRKGTGASAVEHGKESLGRTVEAAVQQADKVPEGFVVDVPMYSNTGLRGIAPRVRCGIYLDVQNERIVIRALADEINSALDQAQTTIHEALTTALLDIPVFRGRAVLNGVVA